MPSNVLSIPKTREQAARLARLAGRDRAVSIDVTLKPDGDAFREQRAWRILFGLFQDCAGVRASKGFRKMPGETFEGRMKAQRLPEFLHEAMPLVESGRARIEVDGERLRPRLMKVFAA